MMSSSSIPEGKKMSFDEFRAAMEAKDIADMGSPMKAMRMPKDEARKVNGSRQRAEA